MDRMREQFKRGVRAMFEGAEFMLIQDGATFYVNNPATHETYTVEHGQCTCRDFQYRCAANGLHCKHQVALKVHAGRIERVAQ
jgi:predicted nucleic acid-binding Zn finger protein